MFGRIELSSVAGEASVLPVLPVVSLVFSTSPFLRSLNNAQSPRRKTDNSAIIKLKNTGEQR
jgi:hypothetical protein